MSMANGATTILTYNIIVWMERLKGWRRSLRSVQDGSGGGGYG